ncbi:MAG: hypothetical protein ACFFDF_08120 [Candidatus Odinarchaeota archaeon]
MKLFRNKSIFLLILIIMGFGFSFCNIILNNSSIPQTNKVYPIYPQAINRTGKVFSNITDIINKDCYINQEFPSLNNQPSIFIPNYNISYAKMSFENITALNYTRNIENDFSEFIFSSHNGPKYVYQKFAIELNQYINNVSILIQDINNPTSFTDENSWEIAIVNCLNDTKGTPNPYTTLGSLKKPHPISVATHWEIFDFKSSDTGSIFLDIKTTNFTLNNGIVKYWFAFKVKIPQDDTDLGGGPKFLYFNPDEGPSNNIGEGATFAISPDFYFDNYTVNNVRDSQIQSGALILPGNLSSFRDVDDDRYTVTDPLNITLDVKFNLKELKNSELTFWEVFTRLKTLNWWYDHYKYIYSFDIYLMLNVSDIDDIIFSQLYIRNFKGGHWVPLDYDINYGNETLVYYSVRNPVEKYQILTFMDNNPITGNNTLQFRLEFLGDGTKDINLSINQFKIEVGELENLDTIQQHDPLIQELYFPTNAAIINGSNSIFGNQSIDAFQYNDNNYYKAQALSNNVSYFVSYNVLENFDSSLWNIDYYDWIASYPNPIVPQMDIRITSNVSKPDNLDLAALALYKGNKTFDILDDTQNKADWIIMSRLREFAFQNETTTVLKYDAGFTWIFLNVLNESRNNEAKLVLVYYTNSTDDYGFNVSVNEFTINLYIQNAITSDISSSIGLGVNNNNLTPSDLMLKSFGTNVITLGTGKGIWEGEIDNAEFSQGNFEFNITSLWHSIRFDVNGTYEIFKIIPILEFLENPASQYKKGSAFFSVKITDYGGKPLGNSDIIFEVLNANDNPIYDTTSRSNEEGIASVTLQFENTGERFSLRATFIESGFYTSGVIISGYIRVVDDFILFMDNFLMYLPYIIIGAIAIAGAMTARTIRNSKLKRFWAGEARILDDLVKISCIMIIHKDVGVSLYNKQISLENIDSDLISGFLQAISQFRSEIKKESIDTERKEFEMDYGDFKIIIADGDYVRVALILDGSPSEQLKENQWLFTEDFEKRFGPQLKEFTGELTPFRTTDDLIEKYFNITLVYPLQLGKQFNVIKLKGLKKALVEVAEQIQKERKFFFISSLLNFALAGRKASRDEIISAILYLKRKGLIVPAEIE